jgi:hypothetical protein
LPEALVFPLDDEMMALAENLQGAPVRSIAQSLRMMALRGIWEGYQRGMRSFCESGPPSDARELVASQPDPRNHMAKPQHYMPLYRHEKRLQESAEDPPFDPLEAEADAVLRAG